MDNELNPTCPAMRHIWNLIENGDKDLLSLYHNNAPFNTALKSDVPIARLLLLYVKTRDMLMDENTRLHLQGPTTIQVHGADPIKLFEAEEARDSLAGRLTTLVEALQVYLGKDFGQLDPDLNAVAYFQNLNRIKANQD